jgi:hypothetical protein
LIAIFTVLGLFLFGGGAYAIYDGWPYLVLERGFTEVIIGAVASSAGLIMLSLAWVLKEIRATRRALVEAIELRTQTSLPVAAVVEAPFAPPPQPEGSTFARSLAPAAIGAVAGAAATSAVAQALAASEGENAPAPAEALASSGDRDLFGALVAHNLQEPEPAAENEPEATSESAQTQAEEAEPLPDMFEEALSTAPLRPAAFEAEEHEFAEPVAADVQPSAVEETFAGHDEPVPFGDRVSDEQPAVEHAAAPVEAVEPIATTGNADELDEFSALRESLADHLNEPARETARIEPSFSQEPDPFAAAETWMDRASPRREPWLDTPSVEEPAPAQEPAPLWPPRTEAHVFDAPAEPVAVMTSRTMRARRNCPSLPRPTSRRPRWLPPRPTVARLPTRASSARIRSAMRISPSSPMALSAPARPMASIASPRWTS